MTPLLAPLPAGAPDAQRPPVSYLASRRCPTRAPAGTGTSSRGGRAVCVSKWGRVTATPPFFAGPRSGSGGGRAAAATSERPGRAAGAPAGTTAVAAAAPPPRLPPLPAAAVLRGAPARAPPLLLLLPPQSPPLPPLPLGALARARLRPSRTSPRVGAPPARPRAPAPRRVAAVLSCVEVGSRRRDPPVVCGPAQWEWRRYRAAAATAVPALLSTEWSRRSSPFLRPASVVMRGAVRFAGATRRRMWPRRFTRDASSPPAGGTLCSAPPISSKGHHGGAPPVFSQRAVCACSVARGCWLMQPRRCVSKPVSCSCSARAARCQ